MILTSCPILPSPSRYYNFFFFNTILSTSADRPRLPRIIFHAWTVLSPDQSVGTVLIFLAVHDRKPREHLAKMRKRTQNKYIINGCSSIQGSKIAWEKPRTTVEIKRFTHFGVRYAVPYRVRPYNNVRLHTSTHEVRAAQLASEINVNND